MPHPSPLRLLIVTLCGLVLFEDTRLGAQDFVSLAHGTRGMTPLEYRELADSAAALASRQEWSAAGDLYARMVEAYPHDSGVWLALGTARRLAGEHLDAAHAYSRAYTLGTAPPGRFASGHAAREYARGGQADSALVWLRRAIVEHKIEEPLAWLGDTAFAGLRNDEGYRALLAPAADGLDRVAGWRLDIDYLLSQIRRHNEAMDPVPDSVARTAEELKERVGSLSDLQVALGMARLVAQLGRSHNGFDLLGFPPEWGVGSPPLAALLFGTDVHIVAADSAHRDLIGARIVDVDGTPIAELLEATAGLTASEGESRRDFTPHFVVNPAILHALGLAARADRLTLKVVDRFGTTRTTEVAVGDRWLGFDNLPPSALSQDPAPLYTRQGDEPYWLEHLPEHGAVYVRLKNVRNRPAGQETLSAFALRLRRFLEDNADVQNLIIDLRRNSGGNTYLYPELMRTVVAFDARQENRTYAIIDRRVFSAGMNFAVDLDRFTDAVFVGEATGASVEQHGDPVMLRLPYSNLPVRLSTTIWNISSPHDNRRWIAPDVPVALTADDYFQNRDPSMDAVLELIRRR